MIIPVITGPTASGKTVLSLRLAELIGSVEIVSADSRQIFAGMDIGTAKPDAAERGKTPHHLIDIVNPDTWYSAGRFAVDARRAVSDILARGKLPVVVGGSGFYIQALFEGLSGPEADPAVYAALEDRMKREGYDTLYSELLTVDPVAAAAHSPNNKLKTLRALACWEQTGIPYSSYTRCAENNLGASGYQPMYIGLMPPRVELYQRINLRTLEMVGKGLVEEVVGLLDRGYTSADHGLRTVGYREAIAYLNGKSTFDGMISAIQQATRRYAKRQMTWFGRIAHQVQFRQFNPPTGELSQMMNQLSIP